MNRIENIKVNPLSREGVDTVVLNHTGQVIRRTEGGTTVPKTTFYRRLMNDGDLVEVKPTTRQKAAAKGNNTNQQTEL